MNEKQLRFIEANLQLRELKTGDVLTELQFKAIDHLIPSLKTVRNMQPTTTSIEFNTDGEAISKDGNLFGVTVNGKKPLDYRE